MVTARTADPRLSPRRWPLGDPLPRRAAGIDEDRAKAWTIIREVDHARYGGDGPDGHDRVTMAVAIIKAMLD